MQLVRRYSPKVSSRIQSSTATSPTSRETMVPLTYQGLVPPWELAHGWLAAQEPRGLGIESLKAGESKRPTEALPPPCFI